jgi:hypothetical protein
MKEGVPDPGPSLSRDATGNIIERVNVFSVKTLSRKGKVGKCETERKGGIELPKMLRPT